MQKLYNWLAREDGQTMAEYGVVLAVITIAVFGALASSFGQHRERHQPRRWLHHVTRTDALRRGSKAFSEPRRCRSLDPCRGGSGGGSPGR